MLKYILTSVLSLLSINIHAKDLITSFEIEKDIVVTLNHKNNDLTQQEKQVLIWLNDDINKSKHLWKPYIKKVQFNIDLTTLDKQVYSNAKYNNCIINMNYPNIAAYNNPQQNFKFDIHHELSHCILGKEVFFDNLTWGIQMDAKKAIDIQSFINQETEKIIINNCISSTQCRKTQEFIIPPPMVVYHELFADILGAMMSIYIDDNFTGYLPEIIDKRKTEFHNEGLKNAYVSYSALQSLYNYRVKNSDKKYQPSFTEMKTNAILLTQYNFLQYIEQRKLNTINERK